MVNKKDIDKNGIKSLCNLIPYLRNSHSHQEMTFVEHLLFQLRLLTNVVNECS